ncbi:MFS transporter [Micromonospora sp. WMMA2032]|uniref:Major Facilitator Superfamily protein n=1 Tax=Micromonospora sediminicola TaxID=946078 RepID=A0A1A9B386_9ACTN|nr:MULTISPECIES: MFS transporter [Micromonospora]ATO15777.1 MFS transporter [Micromonospora sp. WMMA2032]PGH44207.1 MFS transporter [Micromonospora sp. WMMA1996]SBT63494.1 Major Facilitator Superfamily protein [Micromonospora sediminicola]
MTTATAAPASDPLDLWSPRLRAMTVGIVALVSLLAFEALAVGTAMPTVARSLDGLGLYALAFGGPFASGVVAMVVSGIWCDARGPRPAMWHGVAWFVAGLAVAGAATTMGTLVAGRVVQGFGSGLLSVALYVIVGQAYPEGLRRRIFAAFAAAWVVPSLVGPAVAGLIVEHLGWRWVFLAVPAIAVPAVLLVQPGLRALAARVPTRPPTGALARIGWACGAGASAALLHHGGQQRGVLAAGLVGAALAGLLVSVPRLLPAGFLRAARGLPTVIGLRGLASAAFAGAEVVIPLMLSRERGFSPTGAGLVLTVGALSWSVGSWIQGRIPAPRSAASLPRAGLACIAVGTAGVTLALLPGVPVAPAVLAWSVAGLGMGLLYPSLSVLTLELSAPAEQGRNSSALQLGDSLAAATVLALTGAVLAAGSSPGPASYASTLAVAAGCGLLGLLLAGRVVPRTAA